MIERQERENRERMRRITRAIPRPSIAPLGGLAAQEPSVARDSWVYSYSDIIRMEEELSDEQRQERDIENKWFNFLITNSTWDENIVLHDSSSDGLLGRHTIVLSIPKEEYKNYNAQQKQECMDKYHTLQKEITMSRIRREGSQLTWVGVDSSAIAAIAYEPNQSVLFVLFRKGQIYSYDNVSQYKYNKLLSAESKGEYLNKSIIHDEEKHRPNQVSG